MSEKELSLPVLNYQGKEVGTVILPDDLFNAEINQYAIQRAVRKDLANRRVSTAHTLDRSQVHGTNRKPYRQKGTGRARAGTTNSPIWRHGGVVHGPNGEQNYRLKMNKTEAYIAFISALSEKAQSNDIIVLENEGFASTKTKDFAKTLADIKADEKKNLLVLYPVYDKESDSYYWDENLIKASRNIPSVKVVTPDNLSVYDILNANKLILTRDYLTDTEEETQEEAE